MIFLGYNIKDLYDLDLKELDWMLETRRKGLAYELWKEGNLCQMMKTYPKNPEEACPELYPIKKGIKMPDFLKEKARKRGVI